MKKSKDFLEGHGGVGSQVGVSGCRALHLEGHGGDGVAGNGCTRSLASAEL